MLAYNVAVFSDCSERLVGQSVRMAGEQRQTAGVGGKLVGETKPQCSCRAQDRYHLTP